MQGWGNRRVRGVWIIRWLPLAAVLFALPAGAQEWLRDRRNSEGPGIMLSDSMVLHLGLGLEGGYDTNVFNTASDGDAYDAGRLRITPEVSFATLPPQRTENPDGTVTETNPTVDFRFGVAGMYNQYLSAAEDPEADVVMSQSDFGIQSGLDLVVFPRREWSFLLNNTFLRTVDPPSDVTPEGGLYNRDYDVFNLGVRWAPGGGTLEMNLLAGVGLNFFESSDTAFGETGNWVSPRVDFNGRWKFFPNTALTFQTEFAPVIRMAETTPNLNYIASSSYPIRSWVGLNGQWTPVITTALRVGYGASFYDLGDDVDDVLVQAEVGFILGPTGRIRVGFVRDFVDSLFANFYVRNEGYLRYDHLFSGSFLLGVKFSVRYMQFATLYSLTGGTEQVVGTGAVSQNPRSDLYLDGSLFGEYRVKDWLAFNATVTFATNITDFRWQGSGVPAGAAAEEYWKLIALLGARFMY